MISKRIRRTVISTITPHDITAFQRRRRALRAVHRYYTISYNLESFAVEVFVKSVGYPDPQV